MNASRKTGFTLIELLTVIAIIAILAAMVFTIGPGMIERAKMRRMDGALRQVSIALVAYSTDNKKVSYPPAYGYVGLNQGTNPPPIDSTQDEGFYTLRPYMSIINHHGEAGLYDEFSESYDTNRDGKLSLLEFNPVGRRTPQQTWVFDTGLPRYTPANAGALTTEINRQINEAKQRPFVYIPVNRVQWQRASKYWLKNNDFRAETWNPAAPELQNITFPPAKYDAFVLISVGPAGSTFGLVDDPPFLNQVPERDWYHVAALRAYFLATRDLNANGKLDFDFNARTKEGEAKAEYQVNGRDCNNQLPCDTPNAAGPVIFVSQ